MNIDYYTILFDRDINRLINEVKGYTDEDSIWQVLPGTTNSAGHLLQHLIGNLKTYIGNPFGNIRYERDRDAEFSARLFTPEEFIVTLEELIGIISFSLSKIPREAMASAYPREILSIHPDQTVEYVLMHLLSHLSYHMGQINYQRRYLKL
ncbi:DUF1572 family protein [Pedobacter hartonius]|uniref:DinB superfamily protein n=1 Tax=Pedobacter hartonius TaxID=425514 RepID=A0A1H3W9Z5_9SPHI|nr:DUF1572 family protein [Pedobacter hartonius]SDZ83098.1 Protein of unknown function [Pedobacter hartonius]